MQKSFRVLKKAVQKVGASAVARHLNVSTALVYKWCQRRDSAHAWRPASGAWNPLDRVKMLYEITGDPALVQWVCEAADGFFVRNPQKGKAKPDSSVAKNIHLIIREFSETLDAISQSYQDRNIDEIEAAHIRREWEDLKRTGEAFVCACEQGRYHHRPSKERG